MGATGRRSDCPYPRAGACGGLVAWSSYSCSFTSERPPGSRSPRAQASVRKQIGPLVTLLPHTRPELGWFVGVSLTAGICEEFLFRGYFIWTFERWLGWWGAAALSIPFFAALHAYQGA